MNYPVITRLDRVIHTVKVPLEALVPWIAVSCTAMTKGEGVVMLRCKIRF